MNISINTSTDSDEPTLLRTLSRYELKTGKLFCLAESTGQPGNHLLRGHTQAFPQPVTVMPSVMSILLR